MYLWFYKSYNNIHIGFCLFLIFGVFVIMENILLPALVSGLVLFVLLFISTKLTSSTGGNVHKNKIIGQISQQSKSSFYSASSDEVNIIRSNKAMLLQEVGVLAKAPFISNILELMIRSGVWEKRYTIFLFMLVCFVLVSALLIKLGAIALVVAAVVTYMLPMKYMNGLILKRRAKFLNLFPEAIEMIIRSVKSGHPLNAAMRMIVENMESPIKDEFKQVLDEISYGRTVTDALKRMAARLDEVDVNFFVVVLATQQETGGNLTEILSNLSNIIRRRRQLRQKIRALTSEGRATGYILGFMPIGQFAALYIMAPDYMAPLLDTRMGNILLVIAASLIISAVVVVKKMVNIEI